MQRLGVFFLITLLIANSFILINELDIQDKKGLEQDEDLDESEEEVVKEKPTNVIEFRVDKNQVVLTEHLKEIRDGVLRGQIDNRDIIVYYGLNDHMFIDGSMEKVRLSFEDGEVKILMVDFENHLGFRHNEKDEFEVLDTSSNTVCKPNMSEVEVLKLLEGISQPIDYANITINPGQLPGADRPYRSGIHEGIDWYSGAIGRDVTKNTTIYPMFEGEVVRIDKDYVEMSWNERESFLNTAKELGFTPQDVLDNMRGRQVWIESDNNVLVRYAHLDQVNESIEVGQKVDIYTPIGKAGNSGTNSGVAFNNEDIHLHSDILVCGLNFWEYGDILYMTEGLIKNYQKALETNLVIRDEIEQVEKIEIEKDENVKAGEGFYVGRIDSHTIEIHKTEGGPTPFGISPEVREYINEIKDGSSVSFLYYFDNHRNVITEIKEISR